MSANMQSKIARQRRELERLQEQNETLAIGVSVESSRAGFFEEMAAAAGGALKIIRQQLNVPGHEHVYDERHWCVICQKTEFAITGEIAARKRRAQSAPAGFPIPPEREARAAAWWGVMRPVVERENAAALARGREIPYTQAALEAEFSAFLRREDEQVRILVDTMQGPAPEAAEVTATA